jgi:hypothetical protein
MHSPVVVTWSMLAGRACAHPLTASVGVWPDTLKAATPIEAAKKSPNTPRTSV